MKLYFNCIIIIFKLQNDLKFCYCWQVNGEARRLHGGKDNHLRRTTPAGGSTRPHRHSDEKDSREIVDANIADEVPSFPDLTDDGDRSLNTTRVSLYIIEIIYFFYELNLLNVVFIIIDKYRKLFWLNSNKPAESQFSSYYSGSRWVYFKTMYLLLLIKVML